jgi:glycosyltransferase involved in cell wall biosynthesis
MSLVQYVHAMGVPARTDLVGLKGRADEIVDVATLHVDSDGRSAGVPTISVVVPLLNEEPSLVQLYAELRASLDPLASTWEVVFVDDGSCDGSFETLVRLHEEFANVRVVRLRRNFGKSTALAAGFEEARGEVIVTMDADLQDDPAEIPRLLARLDEGYDLVSGWKETRRDPWRRRWLSHVFNGMTSSLTGLRLHDVNCGLKVYRASLVRHLRIYGELHRFVPVLAHQFGFKVTELSVNHRARPHGKSHYGLERYLRGMLDLLAVSFMGRYRYRPLHLFGTLGAILSTVGFGILLYLTALKIGGAGIGERPLLLLGVLLVVVGIQLFSLGLMSEMITKQHEERTGRRDRLDLYADEILR